jgi:hypothetical protein
MHVFGSGQHDDRRRRVLTEEVIGPHAHPADQAGKETTRAIAKGKRIKLDSHSYGEAAHMDRQARITDLVPKRFSVWLLLILTAIAAIAGLVALHAWLPELGAQAGGARLSALDLTGEGNLANWFASTALTLSAVGAVLVYYIRRHKADDYRGRYRIWLWTAAACLLMSIDATSHLHLSLKEIMVALAGKPLNGDGTLWWVAAYALVIGPIGIRLALDMRRSRGSTTALVLAMISYLGVGVVQLEWVPLVTGSQTIMIVRGSELAAHLLLAFAIGLHARYVILEAQGLLPAKAEKPAKKAAAEHKEKKPAETKPATAIAATASNTAKRNDLDPVAKTSSTASPLGSHVRANRQAQEDDYDDEDEDRSSHKNRSRHRLDDDEPIHGDHKLSRSERKALRKQKERMRRGDEE